MSRHSRIGYPLHSIQLIPDASECSDLTISPSSLPGLKPPARFVISDPHAPDLSRHSTLGTPAHELWENRSDLNQSRHRPALVQADGTLKASESEHCRAVRYPLLFEVVCDGVVAASMLCRDKNQIGRQGPSFPSAPAFLLTGESAWKMDRRPERQEWAGTASFDGQRSVS